MELTKDFLKQKQKEYQDASDKHREQSIANLGAVGAIVQLIATMSMEEIAEEDVTLEDGTPLTDALKGKKKTK